MLLKSSAHIKWFTLVLLNPGLSFFDSTVDSDQLTSDDDFLIRFDSLHPSQQSFSYIRMGLPGVNQY